MTNDKQKQGKAQADKRQLLQAHLAKTARSQAQVAKALGVSGAALSSWLSSQYKGDNQSLEAKVQRYLRREASRETVLQIPITATQNYKHIGTALTVAQEEYDIAVITGPAGAGKTTALKAYAQRNNAIYVKAHRGLSMHRLFAHIAELLELPVRYGKRGHGLASLCANIAETLTARDTIVIIDEAEYLSDNSLELLRQVIHDEAGCGLALCGLPKLAGLLRNLANDHEQLLSRVGVFAQLETIPRSDFGNVIAAAWSGLPAAVSTAIYNASLNQTRHGTQPSLRNCAKIMSRMYRAHIKSGIEPSTQLVEEATQLIMTKR